jgi:hypothetical protein
MTLRSPSLKKHLEELDSYSDETIDETLNKRLRYAAARLSLAYSARQLNPDENEQQYLFSLFYFGAVASAKFNTSKSDIQRTKQTVFVSDFVLAARQELEAYIDINPLAKNLAQTDYFSNDVSVTDELDRLVFGHEMRPSFYEMNDRQVAGEIAVNGIAAILAT